MNQLLSAWSKQVAVWIKRQPRWVVVSGMIAILVVGVVLVADLRSSAAESPIPGSGSDPYLNTTSLAIGVSVQLILVVIAIYIAAILFRRWQTSSGRAAARQLALLETLHLSQRRSVYLVRAGQQVFLLGATDQAVTLIGQVTPATTDQAPATRTSFDQQLSIASQKTMDLPGVE